MFAAREHASATWSFAGAFGSPDVSACSPAPLESPSKRRRGLVYAGSKDAWLVEPTMVFENGAERRPTVEELKRFRSVARTPIVDDCAEAPADDSTVAPADADTDARSDANTVAPADSIDEFFVEVSDDTPIVAVAPADDSTGELIALLEKTRTALVWLQEALP